ncbi:MAG: PfkB family carbohydrate kinase, partial [Treponema sp.]|nr:PfkB family carbohydrate kinase [Treponema sp.]
MKQILVLGSTVMDVLISLPRLPRPGESGNIPAPVYRLGGCAYNSFKALRRLQIPALLCSPVGTGVFGTLIREALAAEGLRPFAALEEETGCCYCLIEADGERTFLSHHGAEYRFSRSWMEPLDLARFDRVLISGIEVEEGSGGELAAFVRKYPGLALRFSPGPRINHIPADRMERLLARRDTGGLGPFLHLNENEACCFTGQNQVEAAAEALGGMTDNALVVTLGERGCYYRERGGETRGFIAGLRACSNSGILALQTPKFYLAGSKRTRKSGFLRSIGRKNPQFEQVLRVRPYNTVG